MYISGFSVYIATHVSTTIFGLHKQNARLLKLKQLNFDQRKTGIL